MRPCSAALRTFLDNWSTAAPVSIADLYIFTLATGEVFYYSGFQIPVVAPLPTDQALVTTAAAAAGTSLLTFASTQASWLINGLLVTDTTTPAAIPSGTTVVSVDTTANQISLSQPIAAPGVGSGDSINFRGNFVLGPRFARTKTKVQIGPQVDELEIDVYAGDSDFLGMSSGGNITWQSAMYHGIFDGGYCELLRAFLTGNPPTVVGTITWFYGRIGDVDVGRTKCSIRVKSLLDLLTIQMPRRLYQAACNHIFGQPGTGMCGYDRVLGNNADGNPAGPDAIPLTCEAGSSQNMITTAFVPFFVNSYDNGSIIGTSGLNKGFTRTIGKLDSSVTPSHIYFLKPFIFPVAVGVDTFQLLPGCDHTFNTCRDVFNNSNRYGGFPHIPPPESAV